MFTEGPKPENFRQEAAREGQERGELPEQGLNDKSKLDGQVAEMDARLSAARTESAKTQPIAFKKEEDDKVLWQMALDLDKIPFRA